MKKKTKKKAAKLMNWGKALKKVLEQEHDVDAHRVVELIRELHYIVIVKHGK